MKRLNPLTGKIFKRGDQREDGLIFENYIKKRINKKTGLYYEVWRAKLYEWTSSYNHIKDDILIEIIEEGKKAIPLTSLTKKYNLSSKTIQKIFKDYNINPHLSRFDLNWDTKFFNKKNSKTAYWAGFLMADGSLSKNNNLEFSQKIQSKNVLEAFCKDLKIPKKKIKIGVASYKSNGKKYYFKRCRVSVSAPNLTSSLKNWGLIPNKTYIFKPPKIEKKLLPHYLRGWFDGDGHISVYTPNKSIIPKFQFGVTGGSKHLEWFAQKTQSLGFDKNFYYLKKRGYDHSYDIRISSPKIIYLKKFADILKVKNNFHFPEKWRNFFKYEYFDKVALNILEKIIKNKKPIDAKTCLFSRDLFKEMTNYIKDKKIDYPLTQRRVELEMKNSGLISKVFTHNGKHFRGWIKKYKPVN